MDRDVSRYMLHRLGRVGESWGAIGGAACATLLARLRCFTSHDYGPSEALVCSFPADAFLRAVYAMRCC